MSDKKPWEILSGALFKGKTNREGPSGPLTIRGVECRMRATVDPDDPLMMSFAVTEETKESPRKGEGTIRMVDGFDIEEEHRKPDGSGSFTFDGESFPVVCWSRTARSGSQYLSISLDGKKKADAPDEEPAEEGEPAKLPF